VAGLAAGPENRSSKLTAPHAYVVRDLIQGDLLNSAFNCDASVWQWVLHAFVPLGGVSLYAELDNIVNYPG
jgi:hypothetical protein